MFRKKIKEDPTELELLRIRVRNLEKQVAELIKAPQVQAEELDDLEIAPILLTLANKGHSEDMKKMLLEWSSAALSVAKSRR